MGKQKHMVKAIDIGEINEVIVTKTGLSALKLENLSISIGPRKIQFLNISAPVTNEGTYFTA